MCMVGGQGNLNVGNHTDMVTFNGQSITLNSTNLNMNGQQVHNVAVPSAETDVANKKYVDDSATEVQANLTAHENNKNNPHGVTASQIGAVSNATTVNGKPLTGNISLTAGDVGAATKAVYTATLSTSWSGSGPYTQTVNISGITSDMVPVVDVVLSSTSSTAKNQLAAWACVGKIVTNNGSITATCYDEKPATSIPIQLLVVQ